VSAPRRAVARAAIVLAIATALLTGCGATAGDDFPAGEARAVTTDEAQLLAATRFHNFDAGVRTVAFALEEGGGSSGFTGWVDYANGVGYGRLATASDTRLLLWNSDVVGSHPTDAATAPLPIPDADRLADAWTGGALTPSESRLHTMLVMLGSLGADRPDNPLLLQQSGALWLGERRLDGREVTVFAGPPSDEALPAGATADPDAASVRYWVDATGLLVRLDVRLGGGADWTSVEFGDATGVELGDPFTAAEAGS